MKEVFNATVKFSEGELTYRIEKSLDEGVYYVYEDYSNIEICSSPSDAVQVIADAIKENIVAVGF